VLKLQKNGDSYSGILSQLLDPYQNCVVYIGAWSMNAKRPRDSDVPNHPPIAPSPPRIAPPPLRQMSSQVDLAKDGGEALPTLTNWGGGRSEGSKVVSNARLTNQQRSTIQRAVCSYFLQNKFVPSAICAASFIIHAQVFISASSDVARAQTVRTATMLLCPSSKTCEHLRAHWRFGLNNRTQVCVSFCREV
jgi:hypothetical protein